MDKARIHYLFHQHVNGRSTDSEQAEWEEWLAGSADDAPLKEYLSALWQDWHADAPEKQPDWQEMLAEIIATPVLTRKPVAWRRLTAACILLFMLGGGAFYYYNKQKSAAPAPVAAIKNDLSPGTTRAVLTLADGRRILLDRADKGQLAIQGKTTLANGPDGLTYTGKLVSELLFNTLTTAKGEQSPPLTLSDGTKVWLNAASSIRFPVAFPEGARDVEINGEAYFEIAKDPVRPFHVKANGTDIAVLGTHFNVSAYQDEAAVRTTLLEGSVKVTKDAETSLLTPGHEALSFNSRQSPTAIGHAKIEVQNSDGSLATAWKDGLFRFKDTDIETVMRQLARWYDVDIEYSGKVTNHFIATIPRNVNASAVFRILEQTGGVHFFIDGKKIKVMP